MNIPKRRSFQRSITAVGAPGSFCENAGSAASGSEQKVRRFIAGRVYFRRPARVKRSMLRFRNIANRLGLECPRPKSSSIGRPMDHARSWSGSTNCRRRCRTSATSGWSGCARWATDCDGPKRTSCATEFTNCGSASGDASPDTVLLPRGDRSRSLARTCERTGGPAEGDRSRSGAQEAV